MPQVEKGQSLTDTKITARQKFTKPPAHFTEANLVRSLEDLGIGRPSTYAPTITTIQKREYVERIEAEGNTREVIVIERENGQVNTLTIEEGFGNEKGKLQPTDIGVLVTDYLVGHFDRVILELSVYS